MAGLEEKGRGGEDVGQEEQETLEMILAGSHSDSVVLTPRIVTPSPVPSPIAHSSPTLEKSARRSMVFRSPAMRQNPPRNARHLPIESNEAEEIFTGVFG